MMKHVFGCLLLAVLLFGGCSLIRKEPYHKIESYDLVCHVKPSAGEMPPVRIQNIRNFTSIQRRFAYSHADGRVSFEDYTQWVQGPEQMLENFLLKYFAGQREAKQEEYVATLKLEIFQFELNSDEKKAVLGVKYLIKRGVKQSDGVLKIERGLKNSDPDDAVRAMSECAGALAADLEQKIINIYK